MYEFFKKHGQLIALLLGVIISAIFLMGAIGGAEEFEALGKEAKKQSNNFNFGLYAGVYLPIIALIIAAVFGILQMISNPKGSLKGIAGLIALAVVFFILYSMADAAGSPSMQATLEKFDVSDKISKMISGALNTKASNRNKCRIDGGYCLPFAHILLGSYYHRSG